MILVDSLMVSGLRWVLDSVAKAAAAELDDDRSLRAALLDASVRLEVGEIDEEEFARFEEEVLERIREIRTRREGEPAPIAFGGDGDAFEVDAQVAGDFHASPARRKRR